MKNENLDENRLFNAERSWLFLLVFAASTAAIDYLVWYLLKDIDPRGFLVAIPGLIFSFQLLWLFLEPFAVVYNDRFEITQSFIHRKQIYFTDLQKITLSKNSYIITYNDDDMERLNLFGIRPSHIAMLHKVLDEKVQANLQKA